MAQYIDKSDLVAEIESKFQKYWEKGEESDALQDGNAKYWGGVLSCLNEVKTLIDTLEVKEVDLEAELNNWRHNHFHGGRDKDASGEYLERSSQLDLAKHFFELGLASQLNWKDIRLISEIGEEFMNSEESDSYTDDETYYGAILNKIKQLGRDYKTQRQEIRELNKARKGE